MAVFQSKKFFARANPIATRYRAMLPNHPFLLFGLPFISIMVAGSFFLTPVTAVRYENYDRKARTISQEEVQALTKKFDKVRMKETDIREEYFRLASKDVDDWEPKRVERLPGEPDGIL